MTWVLAGRRIVNTRAVHQAGALDHLLRERGATPLDYPCIAIQTPADCQPLDAALRALDLGDFGWLVLTSANTVFALAKRLAETKNSLDGKRFRCAAIGPATALQARQSLGVECVPLPESYVAESLAESIAEMLAMEPGVRVLLPESAIARPTLAGLLAERGARVTVVTAYQTMCATGGVDLPTWAARGQVDAITFTSSSTVTCFVQRFASEGGSLDELRGVCVACIGEKTAATARQAGFKVTVVAGESTLAGLVDSLAAHFG